MTTNSSQGIDEGGFGFGIPDRVPGWPMLWVESMGHEDHEAEQSQQAGSGPCNGTRIPLPLRGEAEMSSGFFKSDLNIPTTDIAGHNLEHGNSRVGTEEGKRGALATR